MPIRRARSRGTHQEELVPPSTARIALSISTRVHGPADTLPTYRGFLLAMEELQAREGLPVRFEWKMYDDHGDPERSRELAEKIVADTSVVGVVGPMGSTEAFANAPVFDAAGLLQVSPCASHADLCRAGYRTFFRLVPNEEVQGRELARIAAAFLGSRRLAIVHDDDAFGTTSADNVEQAFTEEFSGRVVARVSFAQGQEQYGEVVAGVSESDPDLVFFGVHSHEGQLVSSALRAAGVATPFLGTDGLKTSFFLGGGDDGEAYHTHTGADFRRLSAAAAFRDRYTARWPEDSTYSPEAYDAAMLIANAAIAAGTADRAAVLEQFRRGEHHSGITGPITFDENGERVGSPVSLYRVELDARGEREMVYQGITTELVPND
jgi:branched-chain amino acid transport system substrate-binding protein